MQKPAGYDEAQAMGNFIPVELGGHKLVIKQVNEVESKNGDPMIVVLFDFAPDDKQPGYFTEMFKNDIRPDKKWPNQATQYIMVNDYSDKSKTNSAFKTFTTCVEHSNAGFATQFGIDNWGAQFKGKKIGGVFGEEMDFYNGEEKKKRVLRWFVSSDKVESAEVPEMKLSKAYKEHQNNGCVPVPSNVGDGFMNIPDNLDEELPFN